MGQLQELTIGIADEVDRLTEELGVVPGCPFGNLAVELSTIDGAVRERLERLFESQQELLRELLDGAVAAGELPGCDRHRGCGARDARLHRGRAAREQERQRRLHRPAAAAAGPPSRGGGHPRRGRPGLIVESAAPLHSLRRSLNRPVNSCAEEG